MNRDLAIYGAGGFGREMALMVGLMNMQSNDWNLLGFYDDGKRVGEIVDGLPVLGGLGDVNAATGPLSLIVAVADSAVRQRVVEGIVNKHIEFPVMIHPRSLRGSDNNKFGKGTLITGGCILTVGIELGEFVIINGMCTVGHDVTIGNYTSLMPGCNISGAVSIGENVLIGTGAKILQNLTIGDRSRVGAGAVVTKSVENGITVMGVPARMKP